MASGGSKKLDHRHYEDLKTTSTAICGAPSFLRSPPLLSLRSYNFITIHSLKKFQISSLPDNLLHLHGNKKATLIRYVKRRSASVSAAYITQVPTTKPPFLYQNVTGFTLSKPSNIREMRIYKITVIGFMA